MPIIQIAIGLHGAIAVALWTGAAPLAAKIVITLLLMGMCFIFVYSQFKAASNDTARRLGVLLCTIADAGIVLFGLYLADIMLMVTAGVVFLLLIAWSIAASVFAGGK